MAGDWLEVPLSSVYDFRSGLSKPATAFGSGYPFLSFKSVFSNFFLPKELNERVETTEQERDLCSIKRGDVFLTRTSETVHELGMSSVALQDYENATFNGFSKRLRPKQGVQIVPEYAGYYFRSPKFRQAVTSMSSPSTRASLNEEMLDRLTIVLPPIKEQKNIAKILKYLDDKIELNRKMNETLEAMARALFKSWFVDFDPVRAKAEGRDTGLPKEIADLFPDEFEDSEVGEIPEGWKVLPLEHRLELAYGKPLKAENRREGNVPVFGSNGQIGWHDEILVQGPGVIVGRKGNPGVVCWSQTNFFAIDTTFFVVPKGETTSLPFLFFALSYQDLPSLTADSAVPGLNRNFVYSKRQVFPSRVVLSAFDQQVESWFEKSFHLNKECHVLSRLRDALLPKLISGELRVPEAERLIEQEVFP